MQISIDFALFFDAFIGYKREFVETFFEKSANLGRFLIQNNRNQDWQSHWAKNGSSIS